MEYCGVKYHNFFIKVCCRLSLYALYGIWHQYSELTFLPAR